MNPPGATRPHLTGPAVDRDQGKAQRVEVRSSDGAELLRVVSEDRASALVSAGLAQWRGRNLRLRDGIRWIPRLDCINGYPDLKVMQETEPERYASLWRGGYGARTGRGCLGRWLTDGTVHTRGIEQAGRDGDAVNKI